MHPHKAGFLEKRKILFVKEPERSAELELGVGAAQLFEVLRIHPGFPRRRFAAARHQ